MGRATRLLKIAADFGDADAINVLASIQLGAIQVCSDHMRTPDPAFLPDPDDRYEAVQEVLQACD